MSTPTTLERTLRPGEVSGIGTAGSYRRLTFGPGEPRLLRLGGGDSLLVAGSARRSLAALVHLTDFQLADVASPGRFEFLEGLQGRGRDVSAFVPAQRPQEALGIHAVETMARTLRSCGGSPDTGAPIGLAISTGDNIDNAQLNELTWFMTLLTGGRLVPSIAGAYEGVQAATWPNELFWHPDPGPDRFKQKWGFPDYPDLLSRAAVPFHAGGVGIPWLSCFGNHDGLPFGEVVASDAYRRLLTGAEKPVALPRGLDPLDHESELFSHPERFLAGPTRPVTADADRQIVSRRDFVAAHLRTGGAPEGHGYGPANLVDGTAYAAYDGIEGVRVLILDSTNLDGDPAGSIGARQLAWLEEHLTEVHATHFSAAGTLTPTGFEDRLVVLASHHGLATLTNHRQVGDGPEEDQPRVAAAEIRALIHRFPNVVLWINGHRHLNEVALRRPPDGRRGGFWEVSTASLADWPCQARLVELVANPNGTLSILCTMLDHAADADPRREEGIAQLAAIHRELAANVPGAGPGSVLDGRLEDRNVELVLQAPFPL